MVTGGLGAFDESFRRLDCGTVIESRACPRELELEGDVGPVGSDELGCATEQRDCSPVIPAVVRAVAGGRESGGGAVG
jgi:hypothetical protein